MTTLVFALQGMCATLKDRVNAELLEFIEQGRQTSKKAA
jgi:hypothetical protein